MNTREYDYVIVGAGSAGCTLAYRLTEDPNIKVLILEAGGWDRDPWIHIPLGWGRILLNRLHDWMYFAEPQKNTANRGIECARGRVVGGSSSINAMAYVRGHQLDYARWAANGLPDWSYDKTLPYFRRQEDWQGPQTEYRGKGGPLTTQYCQYSDPLVEAYYQAGIEAGHPQTDDYNGSQQEGFCRWQMTIRSGRRCSAAVAYLRPALNRLNLIIEVNTLATRILMQGTTAQGIQYQRHGETHTALATKEVILSGGVINSPQLLQLSGIGDAAALRAQNITPILDLTGVGANLQDHMSVALFYRRTTPGPLHRKMRYDRIPIELAKTYFLGSGITNDLCGGTMAFLRTKPSEPMPDVQILFNAAPLTAAPYLTHPYTDGFAARIVGLRPESRGTVTLASTNPATHPRIHQNFFASPKDVQTIRDGVRILYDVGKQKSLAPYLAAQVAGPADASDEAIDAYIRDTAITVHHPLGTCRMGADDDPLAVVDTNLKVRGADKTEGH